MRREETVVVNITNVCSATHSLTVNVLL